MKAIYCIINKLNNKRYIGSSKNWHVRKRMHFNQLKKQIHHSIKLQRAWNKYGEENFAFIILEEVEDENNLIQREQWWIDNTNHEYNICEVAGSTLGRKPSKLSRERMSQAHLGEKHPAWRNAIKSQAQGGKNHPNWGKKFSQELCNKLSEAQKQLHAGGYINPMKGKKVSPEKLEKMKLAPCIKIIQLSKTGEIIKQWDSIKIAGETLGIFPTNITSCAKGKVKSAGGFIWKYVD